MLALPQRLMDPEGFLNAVGDFLNNKADNPVKALTAHWKREVVQAVDMIAPIFCHLADSTPKAP